MTISNIRHWMAIAACGSSLTALLASPAMGQQSGAGERESKAAGGLEDIVVTARKRAESIQDVPVSVTAIGGAQVSRYDLTSIERIAARTPDLIVTRSSNGSAGALTIRGIGPNTKSISLEQSVAVVVDGAYYGQGRIIEEGFFDLAQVQVLKGPQALFYGKNATAGVIAIETADPTDAPYFSAKTGYEFNAHEVKAELVGSTPLTETLGIRLAVRASKMFDGYYRSATLPSTYTTVDAQDLLAGNVPTPVGHVSPPPPKDQPGQKQLLGRLTLKWEPSSDFASTLKITGNASTSNNSSWNQPIVGCPLGVSQLNGSRCDRKYVNTATQVPDDIARDLKYGRDISSHYRSFAVNNNAVYQLGDVSFTNVTNYQWNRVRYGLDCQFQYSNVQACWSPEKSSWKAFSNELRVLTSFDGPLNVMVGAVYQKTKRRFEQGIILGGLSNSAASPENQYMAFTKLGSADGETTGAFGQLIARIVEGVEATAGVRYTHETRESLFVQPYVNPALRGTFLQADDPGGVIASNQTFNNWSPEATLTWKPSRDAMIFGSYRTGFKSGGQDISGVITAAAPPAGFVFDEEKAKGFEGGVKLTLLDRQLRFNVSAYRFTYSGLQIPFFNAAVFALQVTSAGAVTKGVDMQLEFSPRALSGLNIQGNLNYNKARFRNFDNAPCYSGQSIASGCTTLPSGQTVQNRTGEPLPLAPEWVASMGIDYTFDVGSDWQMGLGSSVRYSGSYRTTGFVDDVQRKYATVDASLRIGPSSGKWEVALLGKNLTNKYYMLATDDAPNTGGVSGTLVEARADSYGFASMPRTVELQLSVKF
ncbi:Outer membrane receptor proteins, mostly Fe transport [Sphingobium faniae]|nr:Outer membrane receptor proteins, mostly Fe transport [Sphingobium faniae]